jgi:UDP-N-acetylglucosamine 4,6-dehydratase
MSHSLAPNTLSGGAYLKRPVVRSFHEPCLDLDGKSVLITGGTGALGSYFIKTVLAHYKPRRLVVYSRDDFKQLEMAKTFPHGRYPFIRYFLGDIRDRDRLQLALRDVEYVVHAAGMNHHRATEYNPFECMRTNVFGAENLVHATLECGVKKVIAISSDKAVTPMDVFGASKLAAEKIFNSANNLSGATGTRFSVVRYGHVFGSPLSFDTQFRHLAQQGAQSLPVTDERVTHFCMTLEQSANFALSSLELMNGGETFIPKIPSALLIDLARSIAPNLRQHITCLQSGEKLHATLIAAEESRITLEMPDRYVILSGYGAGARGLYQRRGAKFLKEGYQFSSESNSDLLDMRGLQTILQGLVGHAPCARGRVDERRHSH